MQFAAFVFELFDKVEKLDSARDRADRDIFIRCPTGWRINLATSKSWIASSEYKSHTWCSSRRTEREHNLRTLVIDIIDLK